MCIRRASGGVWLCRVKPLVAVVLIAIKTMYYLILRREATMFELRGSIPIEIVRLISLGLRYAFGNGPVHFEPNGSNRIWKERAGLWTQGNKR